MWTRRQAVAGGLLTLLCGHCAHAEASRTPHTFGCCLASEDVEAVYPNGTDTRVFFTGNEAMTRAPATAIFDYALAQTLAKISDAFGVLPGFAHYDDYDSHNAYATERTRLNRADGTVLMGSTCSGSCAPATIIPISPSPPSAAMSSATSCNIAIAWLSGSMPASPRSSAASCRRIISPATMPACARSSGRVIRQRWWR